LATGELYRHLVARAEDWPLENPVASRKENDDDFDDVRNGCLPAGATQVVRSDAKTFSAIKMNDGSLGEGRTKYELRRYAEYRDGIRGYRQDSSVAVGSRYTADNAFGRSIANLLRIPSSAAKARPSAEFMSRCMSEEHASFPQQKQRVAVCLSKSRRRNPLESGADISDDSDINSRASRMA
jgi:hypothetical protein